MRRSRAKPPKAGKQLVERLTAYPRYLTEEWLALAMLTRALQLSDSEGLARTDDWSPGELTTPEPILRRGAASADVAAILADAEAGAPPDEAEYRAAVPGPRR